MKRHKLEDDTNKASLCVSDLGLVGSQDWNLLPFHTNPDPGTHPFYAYEKTPTGSKCKICGKIVTNIGRHVKVHTGSGRAKCSICNKVFSRKDHLKRHILAAHAGEMTEQIADDNADQSQK